VEFEINRGKFGQSSEELKRAQAINSNGEDNKYREACNISSCNTDPHK
jgi:hypothetical protein